MISESGMIVFAVLQMTPQSFPAADRLQVGATTRIAMRLFLGVDGGQSSTTALIGDEQGNIPGREGGRPCNHAAEAARSWNARSPAILAAACG